MESSTATIKNFPQQDKSHRESWPLFEASVWDRLEEASFGPYGLMGFGMSAANLTALTIDGVHAPLANPGVLVANPTAAQTAAFKYSKECYDKEIEIVKLIKGQVLSALSEEAKAHVTEPIFGTRRITLRAAMDILRAEYGLLAPMDIDRQKTVLEAPLQTGTPVREHLRKHLEAHAVYVTAGQAMAEADKVSALKKSVKHVPALKAATAHFARTNATVATQTFALLATALGQAEDNGDLEETSGSVGYSAAITEQFSMATMAKLVAAEMRKTDQRQTTTTQGTIGAKRGKSLRAYCWTHGPCAHSGIACKAPHEGHIATATSDNRQGGRVEPWYNKM